MDKAAPKIPPPPPRADSGHTCASPVVSSIHNSGAKASLVTWASKNRQPPPQFAMQSQGGPAHAPVFVFRLVLPGVGEWTGRGMCKKDAENNCAAQALHFLSHNRIPLPLPATATRGPGWNASVSKTVGHAGVVLAFKAASHKDLHSALHILEEEMQGFARDPSNQHSHAYASRGTWKSVDPEVFSSFLTTLSTRGMLIEAGLVFAFMKEVGLKIKLINFCHFLQRIGQKASVTYVSPMFLAAAGAVEFEDNASQNYFAHFAKLIMMDFLEEAQSCYEKIHRSNYGDLFWDRNAAIQGRKFHYIEGSVKFHLFSSERCLQKCDDVLLVLESGSDRVEFEAEISSLGEKMSETPWYEVKTTSCSTPALLKAAARSASAWKLFKLGNRITYSRSINSLRMICHKNNQVVSKSNRHTFQDDAMRLILTAQWGSCDPGIVRLASEPPTGTSPMFLRQIIAESHRMNSSLNEKQQQALIMCLTQRLTLIQGPPGTGKTHVAVALARMCKMFMKLPLLMTSDSNIAVDNLVSGLASAGLRVTRIGNRQEKIHPALVGFSLEHQVKAELGIDFQNFKSEIYDRTMKRILCSAEVVCCTCSSAASEMLDAMNFVTCVVDEASQATEPSVLNAVTRCSRHVVLIGDHCQLPPTVVCREAELGGLAISLFERLLLCRIPFIMLNTQYRMHPMIAAWPSKQFYNGNLLSGVSAYMRPPARGFSWPQADIPVAFLPNGSSEISQQTSFSNPGEVDVVMEIVDKFLLDGSRDVTSSDIGIVTPYAAQVRLIKERCRFPAYDAVEVASVDGFQGREKQVIIFSCVRANSSGNLGFLADARRVNVMMTRAKRGLVIIGCPHTLVAERDTWALWLQWAYENGIVVGGVPLHFASGLTSSVQSTHCVSSLHAPEPITSMLPTLYSAVDTTEIFSAHKTRIKVDITRIEDEDRSSHLRTVSEHCAISNEHKCPRTAENRRVVNRTRSRSRDRNIACDRHRSRSSSRDSVRCSERYSDHGLSRDSRKRGSVHTRERSRSRSRERFDEARIGRRRSHDGERRSA